VSAFYNIIVNLFMELALHSLYTVSTCFAGYYGNLIMLV